MRMHPRSGTFVLTLALVMLATAYVSCVRAEPPPEAPGNCPKFADVPANYERPKAPVLNEAFEHCLADLSRAQEEVCSLYTEGEVQRRQTINGNWTCVIKLKGNRFLLAFATETAPVGQIEKSAAPDDHLKASGRGYRILFDGQGKIKSYTGFTGRDIDEDLEFYATVGIQRFSAQIDSRTTGQASWDIDGKLQTEGSSSHLPRDVKALPELESALRRGDDSEKWEALQAMVQVGPDSIPYALNVLRDGDELSRERAAFFLGLLEAQAQPPTSEFARRLREEAVPTLALRLREDPSPKVRANIARSLGNMQSIAEGAVPALEEAATNANADVANAAKTALDRIQELHAK